jgi:chemotaxis protein CheX
MQAQLVDIFIKAAVEVLEQETGAEVAHGSVRVLSSAQTSEDITVMIGVTGDLRGTVLLGSSERTARAVVSRMMGESCPLFDELAQSGIAELANVVAGRASHGLEAAGFAVTISPPTLVAGGPGIIISTVNFRRFVVPLYTAAGDLILHAAVDLAPGVHRIPETRQPAAIPA